MAKAKLTKWLKNSYVKTILLGIILLGSVFAFWFGLRLGLRTDFPLLAVASESMTPILRKGDLIIVQGISNFADLTSSPPEFWYVRAVPPEGSIIVFHRPLRPEELIVHRVAEKIDQNGTWFFKTKGDYNNSPDAWGLIPQSEIVGQVVGVVPWIGNVPLFIRTPQGLVLIILLFLVILFIEYVPVFAKKTKTTDQPSDTEVKNPES